MAAFPQLPVAETDPIGIQDRDPDSIKTLEDIARGAQYVTGASGSALVLSDGNVMSCRACSGELAPPVGTRLNTETGFTATCVRTREIIRCDDTGTDPRVDGSSCIELGIRSILAVPLVDGQKIVGVLEVLSNEPNRFSERHAAALKLLARLVETLIGDGSGSNTNPPPDSKSASSEPEKTRASEPKTTCLTCGHLNPQGSQFCNRCGVILLMYPDHSDNSLELALPQGVESKNEQDLKEIYKLVSGSSGLATWDEIYAKLITNMPGAPAGEKPETAEAVAKKDNSAADFGKSEATPEIKSRSGGTIRRRLWL